MSAGANYEEAQAAESKVDFIHKLQLSLKELRESNYWIPLLGKAKTLPPEQLAGILNESNQLRAILSKAVATAKGKSKGMPSSLIFAFCLLPLAFCLSL